MVTPEILQALIAHLNHAAAMPINVPGEHMLTLEAPVDLSVEYVDATVLMIEQKLTAILDQVDAIIRQAHERIIGERRVNNADKTLSLYEPDMHVIVRGKSGAEVEFGNTLFLAEQADGLIIDWHLYEDQAPADSRMLPGHLDRMENENDIDLKSLTGDRGFDSAANAKRLGDELENNICPRNIEDLNERLRNEEFRGHQVRRAQTEARIALSCTASSAIPPENGATKTKPDYAPGAFSSTISG